MKTIAVTVGRTIIERLRTPGRRLFLMLVAGVFLLISLGNPALNLPRMTHDYLFVLDITGSMNVADAGPPGAGQRRLAFARRLVRSALEELSCGSRAGLAVFTEHRTFLLFAPVEICENHLVLSTMIDEIDGSMAWAELSEVAKGLYSGIEGIEALAATGGTGGSAGKTHLVFMTDGHEAPPVHPTLRPKFRGQPGDAAGLIAGIGGLEPVPIPRLDDEGQVIGFWEQDEVMQVDRYSAGRPSSGGGESMAGVDNSDVRDRIARGTEHLSSLRETYLQQLAADTGLDYLRATTVNAFTRALLDPRYARQQSVVTSIAWIPAAMSLLCLLYIFGSQFLPRRGLRRGGAAPRHSAPR